MSRHTASLERVFKDFKATVEIDTPTTTVINWKNENGDTNHYIKFIINNKTLFTTGDLGSNTFAWGGDGKLDVDWLAGLSVDYFFGKRVASDRNEDLWNSDTCHQAAIARLEERIEDGEIPAHLVEDLRSGLKDDLMHGNYTESEQTWAAYLNDKNGDLYFGDESGEYAYSLGVEEDPYRHAAIMFAVKEIAEQLKGEKPAIESTLSAQDAGSEESPYSGIKN